MSLMRMSLSGAVFILVILFVRMLLKNHLPKRTFPVLWAAALIRLLVPFSVPSTVNIYSAIRKWELPGRVAEGIWRGNAGVGQPALELSGICGKQPGLPAVCIPVIIYLAGALLCCGFFVSAYFRWYREFRMSLPVNNDFIQKWCGTHPCFRKIMIRQSQAVTSPLSYGILRPVILLPKETDWKNTDELQYILEHEYIHIRRFDSSLKMVMIAALCIHWFNPFVWGMYVFINRDIELSCDEGVVRRFGRGAQSAYAMTLIHMEEKRSRLAPLCSGFGKDAVEERVIAVMRMKKVSKISGILAAGLVFCIVFVFATSSGASDVSAITQEDTIRKTVPKNYTTQQEIPDTICYEEYIDGSWWGGILAREGKRRLPGTELYQATFAGDLYERQIKH